MFPSFALYLSESAKNRIPIFSSHTVLFDSYVHRAEEIVSYLAVGEKKCSYLALFCGFFGVDALNERLRVES